MSLEMLCASAHSVGFFLAIELACQCLARTPRPPAVKP